MKKIILSGILFLLYFTPTEIKAQPLASIAKDSLSIEALLKIVETKNVYRIYTGDIDTSLKVPAEGINQNPSFDALKKALSETPYRVSLYRNNLFILKEKELATDFPYSDNKPNVENRESGFFFQMENRGKATSENKVYVIGDRYAKSIPQKIILKGKINDSKTGEPLIGVNVIQKEPYAATVTNSHGEYSIELPSGRVQLELSGFNITNSRRNLMLYGNGVFDIELIEEVLQLGEVTITSGRIDNIRNIDIGVEKIQISKIKNIPTVMGEVDILRVLQTLPGVKTVGEASSGFNVRGGGTDQNLILLNNGTIYNPNHLFGFFSAFNSDMIKEAEIYKSSIPAQYGGRISSVLDITGKEASKEKFSGSAGLGLVTSKLNLEIPIIKERTSLLLSGRTTYSDWILKNLPAKSGYKEGTAGFYDIGAVFSHKIDDKNLLTAYGYFSRDRFAFSAVEKYAYNNLNASAKWRRLFNNKLIGNFSAGYDHYDYENAESKNEAAAFKLTFDINQVFAKADFSYIMNEHELNFGAKSMFYSINSGTYAPLGENSLVKKDVLQADRALETALYINDQWELTPKLSVNAGIRYAIFNALGPRTYYQYNPNMIPYESTITDTLSAGSGRVFKTYHGPEFRLSARYVIQDNLSVKLGFNSMQQFIHKLSNTVIMSPTDTWKLSDANIRPQKGWQAATGLFWNSPKSVWETSLEVYYKKMNDYLDYRSGAQILMNHHIETDVVSSEGQAYGVELLVKKAAGKLNGYVGYTYSRTFLRQHDKLVANPVNKGEWYPTDYDKPHDFKLVGNYKFSQRYSFSLNLDYSTGRPTTIPAGKYYDAKLNAYQVYYTDRNSYRIPDYFRSDVSFNIEPSHKLTLLTHHTISFGAYNVTGRKNVYSIYYISENGKIKGYRLSIFGAPIPFITYNIKF
ncbi:TonB-dependent receptor [Bacteroidia bacterium]|nr:TonB-dependent receptor [Bacteroidia bacterium]